MIGLERTAEATLGPVRAEHEVLDHQLAATLEQLAQENRAAGIVKAIVLRKASPGQLPTLFAERIALAGELFLFLQMGAVGGQPVLIGYDLVRCHVDLRGADWKRARSRSEERRVGKECVSTCRSRWSPVY